MDLPIWWWILTGIGAAGIIADLWLVRSLPRAVSLNLRLHRHKHMAQVGDKFVATINPTDANGVNPAPVTNVTWSVEGGGYTIDGSGNAAHLTATTPGTGNKVSVSATAIDGTVLTASADLPDVVAVAVAAYLNLTVVPA